MARCWRLQQQETSGADTGSKTLSLPMGIALDSMGNVISQSLTTENTSLNNAGFDPVFVNTGNEPDQPFGVALTQR